VEPENNYSIVPDFSKFASEVKDRRDSGESTELENREEMEEEEFALMEPESIEEVLIEAQELVDILV